MRLYIGSIILLLLLAYGSYALYRRINLHIFIGCLLSLAYVLLLIIFVFDSNHSLNEEFSWIRYPTSLILGATGFIFFLISRHFKQKEKWAWLALSFGFMYASVDEIVEIHEKTGRFLKKTLSLPDLLSTHSASDLITVTYFIIGLLLLIFIFPTVTKAFKEKSILFGQTSFFAVLLFGLSTFFDTFDVKIFDYMRNAAADLAKSTYVFSDSWYIMYEPVRLFNSIEEVLEYFAAALFLTSALLLLFSFHKVTFFKNVPGLTFKPILVLLVFSVTVLPFLVHPLRTLSPLEKGEALQIASIKNGLFHADDLYYHPNWGVILGNESESQRRNSFSGPGVFVFARGELKRLSDPQQKLLDVDSITANSEAIYAANSTGGKILRLQDGGKNWGTIASRREGLEHPEGLAIMGNALFILDEGAKSISKLTPDGRITTVFPLHPRWIAPEGIAFHQKLATFLITDDQSGTIFSYRFGGSPQVWTENLKNPEDITIAQDGRVIISDNGRREILIFDENGRLINTIRFRLLFRDIQGIALDKDDNLFVVTADSYGKESFISSYLWMVSDW